MRERIGGERAVVSAMMERTSQVEVGKAPMLVPFVDVSNGGRRSDGEKDASNGVVAEGGSDVGGGA